LAFDLATFVDAKPSTDFLTFVYPRSDFIPCTVKQRVGGSQQLAVTGAQCCESHEALDRPMLLVSPEGRVSARLSPVNRTCAGGGCQEGCAIGFDSAVLSLDTLETSLASNGEAMVGSQLTIESERTALYVTESHELRKVRETVDGLVYSTLADHIVDLQVAVGVDSDGDGLSRGPSAGQGPGQDEWLWNANDGNSAALQSAELRMIGLGLVVAGDQRLAATQPSVRLLDGATHTSTRYLRPLFGLIGLRNQPEFQ
jgi:hypothetical protein